MAALPVVLGQLALPKRASAAAAAASHLSPSSSSSSLSSSESSSVTSYGPPHSGPITALRFARGPCPPHVPFPPLPPTPAPAPLPPSAAPAAAPAAAAAAAGAGAGAGAGGSALALMAAATAPLPLPLLLTAGLDGRAVVWRLALTTPAAAAAHNSTDNSTGNSNAVTAKVLGAAASPHVTVGLIAEAREIDVAPVLLQQNSPFSPDNAAHLAATSPSTSSSSSSSSSGLPAVLDADWRDAATFALAYAAPAPASAAPASSTALTASSSSSSSDSAASPLPGGSVLICSASLPTPLLHLSRAHSADVTSLRWCPQGITLATGGADAAVRLWRPLLPTPLAVAPAVGVGALVAAAKAVAEAAGMPAEMVDAQLQLVLTSAAATTTATATSTTSSSEKKGNTASGTGAENESAPADAPLPLPALPYILPNSSLLPSSQGGPRACLTQHLRAITCLRFQDPGPLPAAAVAQAPDWAALAAVLLTEKAAAAAAAAATTTATISSSATGADATGAAAGATGAAMSDEAAPATGADGSTKGPADASASKGLSVASKGSKASARAAAKAAYKAQHLTSPPPPPPIAGLRLASGSLDTTVRVWDTAYGDCCALLARHAHPVTALAWAPALPVALGSDSAAATAATAAGGAQGAAAAAEGAGQKVAFASPGLLATASHERVHVWAVNEATVVRTLRTSAPATDLDWAGAQLACTATDGAVFVFEGNV